MNRIFKKVLDKRLLPYNLVPRFTPNCNIPDDIAKKLKQINKTVRIPTVINGKVF